MQSDLYAAVDLGTNTAKLTIGRLNAAGAVVRELFEAVPVRLGEDLAHGGAIGDESLRRALDCLSGFNDRLEAYELAGLKAISTSALRRAVNADDVLSRIRLATGFELEIISGVEEARLSLEAQVVRPGEALAVLNCGGGSTELASVTDAGTSCVSLELGALDLSRRFLVSDPPRYVELRWLMDAVREGLEGVHQPAVERLVAQGGSALGLGSIKRAGGGNPASITRDEVGEQIRLIMNLDREQRRHLPGLAAERADTILAGALIHLAVLDHLGLSAFEISAASISDGLIRRLALNLN
jgi:exopolyphosphatase/guanosine-5'-triphosphate,3'-diphosphate pyrophosphatase